MGLSTLIHNKQTFWIIEKHYFSARNRYSWRYSKIPVASKLFLINLQRPFNSLRGWPSELGGHLPKHFEFLMSIPQAPFPTALLFLAHPAQPRRPQYRGRIRSSIPSWHGGASHRQLSTLRAQLVGMMLRSLVAPLSVMVHPQPRVSRVL